MLYVRDDLGVEFSMSHDLRSTIFLLNTTFKSTKNKTAKEKLTIEATTKIMKTSKYKLLLFIYLFN
jgi:hypothetical protein